VLLTGYAAEKMISRGCILVTVEVSELNWRSPCLYMGLLRWLRLLKDVLRFRFLIVRLRVLKLLNQDGSYVGVIQLMFGEEFLIEGDFVVGIEFPRFFVKKFLNLRIEFVNMNLQVALIRSYIEDMSSAGSPSSKEYHCD
jgi:hypothetical protein